MTLFLMSNSLGIYFIYYYFSGGQKNNSLLYLCTKVSIVVFYTKL